MKETILFVDDDLDVRTVTSLFLRDAGYNVITVASGEEALQLFGEREVPVRHVRERHVRHGTSEASQGA